MSAVAAPTSMMHTLPRGAEQAAPAEGGGFSWFTKWFRDKPAEPQAAPAGVTAGAIAYQPPQAGASQAPPRVAMNDAWRGSATTPGPTIGSPSETTPIHTAPTTPIAQVTPSVGGQSTPADDARGLREQGHAKDRTGDLLAAEQLYRQAIAADPTSAASVNDLGLCLARQGKLEPSAAVLRQAIMMRPDKQLYRNNIATVLVELGKTDEALAHLKTVCSPAAAHFNVGQLLVRSGKTDEAQTQFEAALQIEPSLAPAHEALAKLTQPAEEAVATQAPTTPEPVSVAQAPAAADVTPVDPAPTGDEESFSGPPSFPRLLPPVLNR